MAEGTNKRQCKGANRSGAPVQKCKGVFRARARARAGARKLFRSRVPAVGSQVQVFRFGYRFRIGIFPHPHLHLITRTRDLRAETWDPKYFPVSGFPLCGIRGQEDATGSDTFSIPNEVRPHRVEDDRVGHPYQR